MIRQKKARRSLLLAGLPATGKTTLALDIYQERKVPASNSSYSFKKLLLGF
jgi:DNA helicase TIP49 (TBP-interacting protein)